MKATYRKGCGFFSLKATVCLAFTSKFCHYSRCGHVLLTKAGPELLLARLRSAIIFLMLILYCSFLSQWIHYKSFSSRCVSVLTVLALWQEKHLRSPRREDHLPQWQEQEFDMSRRVQYETRHVSPETVHVRKNNCFDNYTTLISFVKLLAQV